MSVVVVAGLVVLPVLLYVLALALAACRERVGRLGASPGAVRRSGRAADPGGQPGPVPAYVSCAAHLQSRCSDQLT
jgi:hypothetical protein